MPPQLVVGPLQAYRCWRVEHEGGQPILRSLYYPTPWPPRRPLQAACETVSQRLAAWVRYVLSRPSVRHRVPAWGCQCGIYGCARLEDVPAMEVSPGCQRGPLAEGGSVGGVVALWGRVIQHEQGYRAAYARPLRLFAAPAQVQDRQHRAVLVAIAHRYAIELVSDVEDLVRH